MNSGTHIVSVLCRNTENGRSIGRASRSVGCFPTGSVCMSSSAMDQVQCKAGCCEAFRGFPDLLHPLAGSVFGAPLLGQLHRTDLLTYL